jgi:hypothetical protein
LLVDRPATEGDGPAEVTNERSGSDQLRGISFIS